MPRSTSLDVIPSKETDFSKTPDLKSADSFGRSSLGDIFSPVRDGNALFFICYSNQMITDTDHNRSITII